MVVPILTCYTQYLKAYISRFHQHKLLAILPHLMAECRSAPRINVSEMDLYAYLPVLYSISTKKRPLSIQKQYSQYWANITEIFTAEFSTHLYIACKNLWKFNIKIIFYDMFSITRQKHKSPSQHGLHIHSYLQ